jgi:hypothetical protein
VEFNDYSRPFDGIVLLTFFTAELPIDEATQGLDRWAFSAPSLLGE